jgi:hypothetical protein
MENGARDSTQDWLLSDRDKPPTVAELELRIDEAVAIARASEAAAMSVGAAAIESAEQARRAANLAVRASEVASEAVGRSAVGAVHGDEGNGATSEGPAPASAFEDDRMVIFSRRADRVGARFLQIQRR